MNKPTMLTSIKKVTCSLMMLLFVLALTSCEDHQSDDPQPNDKTDLELVKEGIIGTWQFESAEVTMEGTNASYTGGCDIAAINSVPSWFSVFTVNTDYNFRTDNTVTMFKHCHGENGTLYDENIKYTITEEEDRIIIKLTAGLTFELITAPDQLNANTLKLKPVSFFVEATSAVLTFKRL